MLGVLLFSKARRNIQPWRRRALGLAAWAGALAVLGGSAMAEVTVKTTADGRKVIVNETPRQRSSRLSQRLQVLTGGTELARLIDIHSRDHGLEPRLVQAVMQVESGYNPKALSGKGAMGLMQLMPDTAAELGVGDPYSPDENIRGGARYLRQQLDRFGSRRLALAAYNAGPTAVRRHDGIPPYRETQRYVEKVLALYGGVPTSARVERARAAAAERRAATPAEPAPKGRKVYLTRGEGNRIVFTTAPPKPNRGER